MLHIMKKTWKNRIIPLLLTVFTLVSIITPAFGQEILLHEETESFPVTGGVTYEGKTVLTSLGWQKIHVLRADLSSDNVDIDTLIGKKGLSNRDSLNRMVQDNGAVAGINGDFFIMATPSAPIGPQVSNGKLISSPLNLNDMAAIGLTFDKIPEILRMEFSGRLIAPDRSYFFVEGVNKIRNSYDNIFIYTPDFGSTTPKPGEDAPDLTFLTVKDNRVINISEGKIAEIPTDGLVLMAWGNGANFLKTRFNIGDSVELDLSITPDISNLKMVLGGGAVLVDNGVIPKVFSHNIPGTHPRTAIGFTADKKTMIMATVDGRQAQSRGMTQQEMANLMLKLGAHYALNLDGGGSSTMVVRPFGETQTKVINSVSGGVQRLIPNALGIFSKTPVGSVYGLKIEAASFNIPQNGQRTFAVRAYDENYNIIDIDQNQVKWSVSDDLGYFSGNTFTATTSGTAQVVAALGDISASQKIRVLRDSSILTVEPSRIQVNPGGKATFKVYVTDQDGFKAPIESANLKWDVIGNIGSFNGSEFIASQVGSGAVMANFGGLKAGALVQTGSHKILLDDFEKVNGKNFNSYPAYVKGAFSITTAPEPVYSGKSSGKLTYDFTEGTDTRAAYIDFGPEGKALPIGTTKLGLWIYGKTQGEWLRAAVQDAAGQETVLDIAKSIDWNGWRWVEVSLPTGKEPFSLKTIYAVEIDPEEQTTGTIYIDDLTALVSGKYNESLLPAAPVQVDEANQKGSGSTFGVVGTRPLTKDNRPDYDKTLNLAAKILNNHNSGFNAIVGRPWADDKTLQVQLENFRNYRTSGSGYSTYSDKEATFIFLDATKGSLRTTNYNQWLNLKRDLSSVDKSKALFIVIDRAPEAFSDTLEGNLLKKLLTEHAKTTSSSIWVLSGGQTSPFSVRAVDGVRYVSVPGLDSAQPATIVFNVSNGQVNYQVIPLIERIISETSTVKTGIATNLKIYGISPTNKKIPLTYPYAVDWKVSYNKPSGFDPKTLAFKAIDSGTASIQITAADVSVNVPIIITDLTVMVNKAEVSFPDQLPYINKDSRTMVPVRFISESLGAQVEWDNDNRMVIIKKANSTVKLKIGENKADVNGKTVIFDTKAIIRNNRTMVPVRFISEALGAKVSWNQETKTVEIEY